tara:strand:- start:287 stop:688 length:402 start_codon:yes stop_codon:yes gene_type:complete
MGTVNHFTNSREIKKNENKKIIMYLKKGGCYCNTLNEFESFNIKNINDLKKNRSIFFKSTIICFGQENKIKNILNSSDIKYIDVKKKFKNGQTMESFLKDIFQKNQISQDNLTIKEENINFYIGMIYNKYYKL